jgi:hypothetical protein
MSFKHDFPEYSAIHFHVHQAGAERDVYTGAAIAGAVIAVWAWVGQLVGRPARNEAQGAAR